MLPFSPTTWVSLLAWGTLVGLDLVSVPQLLLSRPLVAGTVAGWLVGDVESGLRVGMILELFALDILAVGGARYPDYGPGTVAAVALAAGPTLGPAGLGPAILVGLAVAGLGGWSLSWLRHANSRSVQQRTAALAAGDMRAIRGLQYLGLWRDAARSLGLTALGLGVGVLAARWPLGGDRWLEVVAVTGSGAAAAATGALRNAGRGARLRWLAAGAGLGTLWTVLR